MCRGYERRRSHEFEHTRVITYMIAQVNSTKPLGNMEKWWPLLTDEKEHIEDLNKYAEDLLSEYKRLYPKRFGKA